MIRLLYILALLSVFSCNPCKRIQKNILKHPECVKMDSILVMDSIKVLGFKTDTVLNINNIYDTVTIVKNNLKIKVVRVMDSIYVDATVKDSIVYKSRWKYRTVIVEKPRKKSFLQQLEDGFKWLAILVIALLMFKNAKSN